jgi:enoyl-[acyl-carrier-protein] reductase (NADH)
MAPARFWPNSPTGVFVTLQDVTAKVQWLCSDAAAGTTGQVIVVDGGAAAS